MVDKNDNVTDVRHGTRAAYTRWGCRCPGCRAANTEYLRTYLVRREAGDLRRYRKRASS